MKPIEPWHIVVANLAVLAIALLISRWHRGMFLGWFGIAIIILPSAFAFFERRLRTEELVNVLAGVVILAADLRGKLPDRATVRKKLFRKDSSALR